MLRGHLVCPGCQERLTGSASRGRSSRYWYYHCHRGCKVRFRAGEANEEFAHYLAGVELAREISVLYEQVLADMTQHEEMHRRRQLSALHRRCQALEGRLLKADEAYVEGRIAVDSYGRLKAKYEGELHSARIAQAELEEAGSGFADKLRVAVAVASNLGRLWQRAPVGGKHEMLVRIFPGGLHYREGSF